MFPSMFLSSYCREFWRLPNNVMHLGVHDDMMVMMNERNRYVKLARERGAVIYHKMARFLRNKCNKLVTTAKGDFIRNKLHENKKVPKRFWRQINTLLSPSGDTHPNHRILNPDTGEYSSAGVECEIINNHYATVGSKTLANHNGENPWDFGTNKILDCNGTEFDEIDQGEVEYVIDQIEIGKSSGMEHINSYVLKISFISLLPKLTYLFNRSILSGTFPTAWAHGTITPIPKSGDLKMVGNWRPITLVPLPGKILEHLIHKRLFNIFMDANLLSNYQFGFVPGRSTSQAVFNLYKDLSTSNNNGNLSALLFVDLSKAFDSIHHGRLLNKLSMLGLNPRSVNWLSSYLTRTQTTMFNGNLSSKVSISSGVPQGSVLGPLLFTIYINDICDVITECKVLLYADDCVLYTSHRQENIVHNRIINDAKNLLSWCTNNLLCINVKKTKSMLVGTRHRLSISQPLDIRLNNVQIETVKSYNYLGVIFESELSMNHQLTEIHNRVQQKLFHLRKIRKFINEFTAFQIYKQTILPILDYCGFLSMSGTQAKYNALQILQNDALWACVGFPHGYNMSRDELHKKATLSSIFQRWDKQLTIMMYDEAHRIENVVVPIRATRQALKMNLKQYKLHNKRYTNSPYIRGKSLWDSLPNDVQRLPSKFEFKSKIKMQYTLYDENYLKH